MAGSSLSAEDCGFMFFLNLTAMALQRVQRHSGICFQSRNATLTIVRAPIAANLDSICLAFTGYDLWFQSEKHRTKEEVQLRRGSDSEDMI